MKRVAVLGGGPAGSFAAHKLAQAGIETVLFDEKLAWEKPCGGGVTAKAWQQYPFLFENSVPKQHVTHSYLTSEEGGTAELVLQQPILIYSRKELNQLMLDRAQSAGVDIHKTRVIELKRNGKGWIVRTRDGEVEADYCILATGARNSLRDMGTALRPADTMVALGYYVPAKQPHIDIQFFSKFEGYIWIFPRHTHLSIGICGKGHSAQALRTRLEEYMKSKGIDFSGAQFYSHLLPCLEGSAWKNNRIAGDGWFAVGDSAGFVDPFTGEGIYYAVRSAELATNTLLSDCAPTHIADSYRAAVQSDFTEDLAFCSNLSKRLYLGNYLFRGITDRTVDFMRRSPEFVSIIHDMFVGTQPYLTLRARLLRNSFRIHKDVLLDVLAESLFRYPKKPDGLPT